MGINKTRELRPEVLGINDHDPYFDMSSASRKAMMATHLGQAAVPEGVEPRFIFTGSELEAAQNVFDIRFPVHCRIVAVVRKYQAGGSGYNAIPENTVTTIIYEEYYSPSQRLGVIHVPHYMSHHQDFGYPLIRNQAVWDQLTPGMLFEADTVIATSPAVRQDGSYGQGINANVIFISDPCGIEDGLGMSESFCKRMSPRGYGTLIGSWGKKRFPLNLHGTATEYKPFPDIGELLPDNGLAMAFRDIDPRLGIADMTPLACRTVEDSYDRPLWGKPNARVIDIKVYHDDRLNPSFTPVGMDTQARKYYDGLSHYYRTILDIYNKARRNKGAKKLRLTPELGRLIVEAQLYLPVKPNERKLTRMNRLEVLDEWRVELTYEWVMPFNEGYKATDLFGGKGVNCKTIPDAHMPTDENDNVADVVIYGNSTFNRTNMGRLMEHFFNAASRDLKQNLRLECGLPRHGQLPSALVKKSLNDQQFVDYAFNKLLKYYSLTVPNQYEDLKDHPDPTSHVRHVLEDNIYLNHPPNNPISPMDQMRNIMKSEFVPHYGKVTYVNNIGEKVVSDDNMLIAPLYMIVLEKNGEDYSACASTRTQHFGVPAKLAQSDRNTTPAKESSVRGMGESESRSWCSNVGPEPTMEIMDLSNNPESHKFAVRNILTHQTPTNIDRLVDRKLIPYGGSRPVNLVKHILACRGLVHYYKNESQFTPDSKNNT